MDDRFLKRPRKRAKQGLGGLPVTMTAFCRPVPMPEM
jgi:hypothetical protein